MSNLNSLSEYQQEWLDEQWVTKTVEERRSLIHAKLSDAITCLLYYNRKEDDSFGVGALEWSVENGDVTAEEIIVLLGTELVGHVID